MLKIGVIANNSTKINVKNRARVEVLRQFSHKFHRFDTTTALEQLEPLALNYLQNKVDVLAICGGDGTINRTISAFIKVYSSNSLDQLPAICLLGGGTANVLAQNLGHRSSNPIKNIKKLIENKNLSQNQVNLKPLAVGENFGFLFADGFVVSYLEKFYENKNNMIGASLLAVKLAISGLLNGASYRSLVPAIQKKLRLINNTTQTASLTTFVSVVDCLPTGIKLFPNTMKNINNFTVVDFSLSPKELVRALPLIMFYRPSGVPYKSKRFDSDRLVIEQDKPWKYTIDGEIFCCEQESLSISLGPMLRFYLYTK